LHSIPAHELVFAYKLKEVEDHQLHNTIVVERSQEEHNDNVHTFFNAISPGNTTSGDSGIIKVGGGHCGQRKK